LGEDTGAITGDSLISNFLGTNEDDDDEEDKIVDSKTKVS
jgi:hypothetical protein